MHEFIHSFMYDADTFLCTIGVLACIGCGFILVVFARRIGR